ncbi:MAG: hypothetical protein COA65_00170 [Rhodospirillaceae bacterium]|nr:MAG: hypothetical protein COA65_00170 [Rhodospirillaceae bacterium]
MKISQKDPGLNETREELRQRNEGERRLRSIVDATPLPLFITSATDGRVLYANAKTETLTGLPPAALCGRKARDFYAKPEERDALFEMLEKKGLINDHQVEMRKSTGETITVLLSLHPVIYENDLAILTSAVDITERLRSKEALRESEERFRSAFEMAPHGTALVDLEGKWLKVNHALSEMIGYSETELKTTDFQAITHPDDLEASLAYYKQMLAGEITTYQIEKRYFHKDGHVVWALLAVSMVRDSKDAPLYFVTQIYNLTDRKAIEAQLRESEARFRNISERAPVAISINRISDGTFLYINPWTNAFYGFGPGELIGKQSLDLYQDPKERTEIMKLVLKTGHLNDREVRLKSADGTPLTAIISYARIAFDDEDAVMTVAQDVSELKKIETALRESEQRFRAVVEGLPLPLLITRLSDGQILFANSRVGPALDLPVEKIIGAHAKDFYQNPEDRSAIIERTRKHGGIREHELKMKKADGTPITVLLSTHPVTFRGEEAVLAAFQDITAFKKAEEAFLQATKMDAIGQLAGGIVHDFNNLLGVIIGNLELLEERSHDEATHNFARRALGAADRGAALTQRLLAFSRKQALEPKPTDLNRLIAGMTELFEHSLAKAIEIQTDPGNDLWPILIDPNQLESVILNLSLNAQDAMPKGGKLMVSSKNVTIDAKNSKEADLAHGRYVLLTVRDNGAGIPKKNLAHVFDPFFTTKDVGKGSGLGLSVVYGFIRQSNGDVRIESRPGKGTTVKIYLPTTKKKESPSETALPMLKGLEGNGETILIVEDDVAMLSLVKRLLTSLNYRVLEAKDTPSALRILETASSIDLLFSDVVLPHGMNGVTLAKEARQNHPGLKILLTSGYLAELPDRSNLSAELIKKPYRKRALAKKIREVLAA